MVSGSVPGLVRLAVACLGSILFAVVFATRSHSDLAKAATKKAKPEPNPDATRVLAQARARLERDRGDKPPNFELKRCHAVEEAFLDGLRAGQSVSRSAWRAEIHQVTAYTWRRDSLATLQDDGSYKDDFCARWQAAYDAGVEMLEDEATRRAVHGVEKPVYQGGVLIGSVTEYSDTLLSFALRGKNPKVYNTERHEHTGADGGAIQHNLQIEFVNSPKDKKS